MLKHTAGVEGSPRYALTFSPDMRTFHVAWPERVLSNYIEQAGKMLH
jgi:hypothetical protein